jgi:cobalt-precorrin-5B (C1)-methyltransferase
VTRALRRGWTTGTCAAAATKVAWGLLLGVPAPVAVTVRLPRGGEATLSVAEAALHGDWATAGIVKDAGDDPDVTHGCLVRARVERPGSGAGILFRAGEGVGTVTRAGLTLPVGEPAINPVPRAMIARAIGELAAERGVPADAVVTISIPGGEEIARKTLNGRLGIVGGLSILGTTGVVVPFSCSSWIHGIHRGIDVARAAGLTHVAAAAGSTSERVVRQLHGLPEIALIDMGDFAGATFKYLRRHPLPRLTLGGGFGKLVKLAQGHRDLHSARSEVDLGALADLLGTLGAPSPDVEAGRRANTANEVLGQALRAGLPLGDAVAERARRVAAEETGPAVAVEVVVVDRAGNIVGRAAGW